ncbi:MAG: tetratricopeptide repeat protein [Proteobacteria bacterium]|nr:tetratricopeptide repeat protein [Pseudomonadota bacterium]
MAEPTKIDSSPSDDPNGDVQFFRKRTLDDPESAEHHLGLGGALIRSGDYSSALESLKQAVKLDPNLAEANYNLAFCYQHLGFKDSAIVAYQDALAKNPGDDQAWSNLGVLLSEREKPQEAIHCYEKSVQCNPRNLESWKHLSAAQYLTGKYPESAESMQAALEIDDSDSVSWDRMGLSLHALNRLDESITAFSRALAIDDRQAETWNNLGNSYLKSNRIEEAEKAYRGAIELSPDEADFWFNLGELVFHHISKNNAIACFRKVTELKEDDLEAWEYLARSQQEMFPEEARKSLTKILNLGGENAEILGMLADLYRRGERKEEEIRIRLRLAKTDGFDADNIYRIAVLKLAQGDPESALGFLRRCASISEKQPKTWFRLAQWFRMETRAAEELDCLEQVVKADPDHFQAWARLGGISLEKNLPQKAFQFYMKAAPALKNERVLWKTLMERLVEVQEYELAVQCCEPLLSLAVYSPRTWTDVFEYFKGNDQSDRLVQWLEVALRSEGVSTEVGLSFVDLLRQFEYAKAAEELLLFLREKSPENGELNGFE